jgi:class 3 adenylate cyclase
MCGAALPAGPVLGERRKTVTAFCDVTEFTAVAERLKPESFRQLMRQ